MIQLYDVSTGTSIGTISDEQFQFLDEQLEAESADDEDYYINGATLDMFESTGGDPALITLLRTALGSRESMDVRWTQE